MIWHQVALAIWLLDFLSWLVYASAAWRLLGALADWRPVSWDQAQLKREAGIELAAFQGRWLVWLQAGSLALYVIGVSMLWPAYVPGAMCGTGVLQAMGAPGAQTLVLRLANVVLLLIWRFVQRLEESCAEHLPTPPAGRLLLLCGPLLLVSAVTLAQAMAAVQPDQAVSCCAALLERMAGAAPASMPLSFSPAQWAVLALAGGLAVAAWGGFQWRRPLHASRLPLLLGTAAAIVWLAVAVAALKYSLTPYIYEVLWHPCLWCLFLPEHGGLGFVFFGLLGVVAVACATMVAGTVMAKRFPVLHAAARNAVARAGLLTFTASLVFIFLAAAPAMVWRLRCGTWLY